MNERIKEIALQAGGSHYPDVGGKTLEKFAELIVRECIQVALDQKQWIAEQRIFNAHDRAWNNARIQQSQRIADKIKEQFGVKDA